MSDEQQRKPIIESPPNVDPSERKDTDYSPSSDREVSELQQDQAGSPALQNPDIDRSKVKVLPGTGDYTDTGDVEVDEGDVHIPRHPDADGVGPVAQARPDDEIRALGRRALPLQLDVTDLEQGRAAVQACVDGLGGLDVLVNNAGGSIVEPAAEVT